jgi:hypothetical protein
LTGQPRKLPKAQAQAAALAGKRKGERGSVWSSWIFADDPAVDVHCWTLLAILLAFFAIISYCQVRSLDLFFHLKTGEWIWQQHSVPRVDPFSYSAAGKPWVSHEWLFGLLSYLAIRLGGIPLVIAFKAALIALIFGMAALTARARGARPAVIFLVLSAGYAIVRLRLSERPELLSLPLAVGFLLTYEKSREHPCRLLILPLLQLVWANCHGGTALLGWLLAGSFVADRWFTRYAAHKMSWQEAFFGRELLPEVAALAGVVLSSFANPHWVRALVYGQLRAESPLDNTEFQSLFKLMSSGLDLSMVLFLVFGALLALAFLSRPRSARPYEILLFPLLVVMALTYFRFRTLFVFLLAPSLALQLSTGKWLPRLRWWLPVLTGLMLLIYTAEAERKTYIYRFGPGIHSGLFPQEGVDFIKRSGLTGRMYNSYGIGGFLIWELWPGQKVFIDGREDVYLAPGVLEDYVHGLDSQAKWLELTQKYGFDFAILRYPEQAPASMALSLETIAFPRQEWGLVYFDDVCVIYARRTPANQPVLQKFEIRQVQPLQLSAYLDAVIRDPQRFQAFQDEIATNLEKHPASFRDRFIMGMVDVKRGAGFLDAAASEFQKTIELNPDFLPSYINLERIYVFQNRFREASALLRKAYSIEPRVPLAQELKRLENLR